MNIDCSRRCNHTGSSGRDNGPQQRRKAGGAQTWMSPMADCLVQRHGGRENRYNVGGIKVGRRLRTDEDIIECAIDEWEQRHG